MSGCARLLDVIVKSPTGVTVEEAIGAQDRVVMGLDPSAMEKILQVLTNLYNDPRTAILREYTTNGIDAHIEAGVKRPVEVILPSYLTPELRIRDFGIGMNWEDIRKTYSQYGRSTKETTNLQTGCLGLGSKSALAYTSSFVLVARKDGVQTTAQVKKGEEAPVIDKIGEEPTTDPNGVEVIIPTKTWEYGSFERAANRLFRFYEPGTVLIEGKAPEPILGLPITDDLMVTKDVDAHTIVMGNVPYPVKFEDEDENLGLHKDFFLVARVPLGMLEFAPSREALRMTRDTRATLEAIKQEFLREAPRAVSRLISSAHTPHEAMAEATKFRTSFGVKMIGQMTYKGKEIPKEFGYEDASKGRPFVITDPKASKHKTHDRRHNIPANWVPHSFFFVGYDKSFTGPQKQKLLQFCKERTLTLPNHFILSEFNWVGEWADPARVFNWADVNAIRLPRKGGSGGKITNGRAKGSYDAFVSGVWRYEIAASELDTRKLFFYLKRDFEPGETTLRLLDKYNPGMTVVELSANRVEKFKRDFPQTKCLTKDDVLDLYERLKKKITKTDQAIYQAKNGRVSTLSSLDPSKVADPELRSDIRNLSKDYSQAYKDALALYKTHRYHVIRSSDEPIVGAKAGTMDKYPLLRSLSTYNLPIEHVYIYLNAAHKESKK